MCSSDLGLAANVKQYVKFCQSCAKNKTSRQKMAGNLQPIDPPGTLLYPTKAFESINMDLITQLPPSHGHDAILVIVDRLTKCGIFIPTKSNYTSETLADLFMENVVKR